MADSTAPAVIDALVNLLGAIPGVEVQDGPLPEAQLHDVIALGVGNPSVSYPLPKSRGLSLNYDESYSINSLIWSWGDGRDYSARRIRCSQILAAIRAALEPDKTLNGICQWAAIAGGSWQQSWVGEGSAVQLSFSISVKATI